MKKNLVQLAFQPTTTSTNDVIPNPKTEFRVLPESIAKRKREVEDVGFLHNGNEIPPPLQKF